MTDGSIGLRIEQRVLPRRQRPRRRTARYLLLFVSVLLLANALVGERGLMAIMRENRKSAALAASIDLLRSQNAALREQARQLREEPRTIEELARQELGLIRPGEKLFIITDVAEEAPQP